MELVLASRSPRRRHLLDRLGFDPIVHPSDSPEVVTPAEAPRDVVRRLAAEKAADVATGYPGGLILGADTIVVLDGDILGKPADSKAAIEMLGRLSGRTHTVFTGISLVHPATGRTRSAHEATEVTFGELTAWEIERYVATGSPLDKAGAYGIQDDTGALFVDRIDGDYYNVVGLPLRRLYRLLTSEFPDLLVR